MARGKPNDVDPASLAGRLRALRAAAGLTQGEADDAVKQRADVSGFSQSTLSRIEAGKSWPTPNQIRALVEVYGVEPAEAARLIQEVEDMAATFADERVVLQVGNPHHFQQRYTETLASASRVRSYQPTMVLGPLQTRAYMAAIFTPGEALPEQDAAASLEERMAQTTLVRDRRRQFHLIQTEGALRYPVHSYALQTEQLEHIVELTHLENLRFGVVPLDTVTRETGPLTGFHIYDDDHLIIGTDGLGTALLDSTKKESDGKRIATYAVLFESLVERAVYGDEARDLIAGIAAEYRSREDDPVT